MFKLKADEKKKFDELLKKLNLSRRQFILKILKELDK